MRRRHAAREQLPLQEGGREPVGTFDRQERAGVEDQSHLLPRRPRERGSVRLPTLLTMTARLLARRDARSISSGEISPCSPSYACTKASSARSRWSCSTLSRRASFTQALRVGASPRRVEAAPAAMRFASTEALSRCFGFIHSCYHFTTNLAKRVGTRQSMII